MPHSTSPDRFISSRRTQEASLKSFRVSKPLSSKTAIAHDDPFDAINSRRLRDPARLSPSFPGISPRPSHRSLSVRLNGSNGLDFSFSGPVSQRRYGSVGSVWNVGGLAPVLPGPIRGIDNGHGGRTGSGTNAPIYTSKFFEKETLDQDLARHERRLALALAIDQANRVLDIPKSPNKDKIDSPRIGRTKLHQEHVESLPIWQNGEWIRERSLSHAPGLRDDYYCSILAYCFTSHILAVGLQNRVYLWSERSGVEFPQSDQGQRNTHVTSLSFSSPDGGLSVLAVGRSSGMVSLWKLGDAESRHQCKHPNSIACLAFKPVPTRRPSRLFGCTVWTEELLVGDEQGILYYYSIEWSSNNHGGIVYDASRDMTLMVKINLHSQQICGLGWSPDGLHFATGGNDNLCCLWEVSDILARPPTPQPRGPLQVIPAGFTEHTVAHGTSLSPARLLNCNYLDTISQQVAQDIIATTSGVPILRTRTIVEREKCIQIGEGRQKHKWTLGAAVKAIAFCPWQRGLLATGGGSNDRAIHFYHSLSGACLATINVQAQVTSLIWSTTRREIAATFGYAQPDHPYRIAVFSWPDCRQLVAIPWAGEMRALYAIRYPGGPNASRRQFHEGGRWWPRTDVEGCIVVASSDEAVKFHEVWTPCDKPKGTHDGLLGGSDILESLEGADKEGMEVIR